jgi:hypothetical protein
MEQYPAGKRGYPKATALSSRPELVAAPRCQSRQQMSYRRKQVRQNRRQSQQRPRRNCNVWDMTLGRGRSKLRTGTVHRSPACRSRGGRHRSHCLEIGLSVGISLGQTALEVPSFSSSLPLTSLLSRDARISKRRSTIPSQRNPVSQTVRAEEVRKRQVICHLSHPLRQFGFCQAEAGQQPFVRRLAVRSTRASAERCPTCITCNSWASVP